MISYCLSFQYSNQISETLEALTLNRLRTVVSLIGALSNDVMKCPRIRLRLKSRLLYRGSRV